MICCMLQAVAEWEAQAAERAEAYAAVTDGLDASATEPAEREFVAYVPLPEQEEIEARVRSSHAMCCIHLLLPSAQDSRLPCGKRKAWMLHACHCMHMP